MRKLTTFPSLKPRKININESSNNEYNGNNWITLPILTWQIPQLTIVTIIHYYFHTSWLWMETRTFNWARLNKASLCPNRQSRTWNKYQWEKENLRHDLSLSCANINILKDYLSWEETNNQVFNQKASYVITTHCCLIH